MAKPLRKLIRPLGFPLLRLIAWFAGLLGGIPLVRRAGEWLGELRFRLGWRKRRDLERQLARLFPETDAGTRLRQLREAYRTNDSAVMEAIGMGGRRAPDAVIRGCCDVDGIESLRAALQPGRGVIALGMHMGNGLMAMARLAVEGLPVSIVYRASRKFPEDFLRRVAERHGMEGISASQRSQAYRAMLRALQQGRILFVLMDQGTKYGGVPVQFLGKQVELPEGPFRLAARTGAPVFTVFASAARPRWQFAVAGPLDLGDGSAAAAAAAATQAMEAQIRAYPGLWSWHHRRWGRYPFLEAATGS
jgi:phosphatidylinositol dimannoside acyltransferase